MMKKAILFLFAAMFIFMLLPAVGCGGLPMQNPPQDYPYVPDEYVLSYSDVTMEYIYSNSEITEEYFNGVDIGEFLCKYDITPESAENSLNLIPDLIMFYWEDLLREPTIDYSVIYDNAEGRLTDADIDKIDTVVVFYNEGDYLAVRTIDISERCVYTSIDECCSGNRCAELSDDDITFLRDTLRNFDVASWKNEYNGTSACTTGHFAMSYAFRLSDGRCMSYSANGVHNPGMPRQMTFLYDELVKRFPENYTPLPEVTMEYIIENTDLTEDDFFGVDFDKLVYDLRLSPAHIDNVLDILPDAVRYYQLAFGKTVEDYLAEGYTILYNNYEVSSTDIG